MKKEEINIEESEEEFLRNYRQSDYPTPAVASDVVLFSDNSILLVRRKNHPFKGSWAIPGGFTEPTETVEYAGIRELKEETGIAVDKIVQAYTYSTPGRDPRSWIMSVVHYAVLDTPLPPSAGDDAADARWFEIDYKEKGETSYLSLRNEDIILEAEVLRRGYPSDYPIIKSKGLAFDHAKIITYMYRLKTKVKHEIS